MATQRPAATEYTQYHKDGTLWAKGQTIDGVATGYWEWYRKDGTKLRSGHFEAGQQVGQWTTYDASGRVYKVTTIKPKPSAKDKPRPKKQPSPRRKVDATPEPRAPGNGIDEYLAALPEDKRVALERLRALIRKAVPMAEECLSYRLPTFRLDGRSLVAFGATAKHCGFYPLSGTAVEAHREFLQAYDTSKGCIRFQPGKPLPATLVRKLIKYRIAENAG